MRVTRPTAVKAALSSALPVLAWQTSRPSMTAQVTAVQPHAEWADAGVGYLATGWFRPGAATCVGVDGGRRAARRPPRRSLE